MRKRKLKKLLRYIKDTIKEALILSVGFIGIPLLMFIYWIIFGY